MPRFAASPDMIRRHALIGAGAAFALSLLPVSSLAQQSDMSFAQWVEWFRAKARARGVSDATYDRVMRAVEPDTSVYESDKKQPEFQETVWQYINRRVSEWRINTGKAKFKEHHRLLERIEHDYGVDRYALTALWGMESAYGEVIVNPKYMKPILPCLAALAWGDARRRSYWEQELANALLIIEKGWAAPEQMQGSWAGAMGHTQWMPEVWLNMGVDYDGDGRIFPFGKPDDALAGTAQYMVKRGKWRRGEGWGYEVKLPANFNAAQADGRASKTIAQWQKLGVTRANGQGFPRPGDQAKLRAPAGMGGPAFLLLSNFFAIRSYNPSFNYTLAIAHLGDRIRGGGPFIQPWPVNERQLSLVEIQEMQEKLTALGFDTNGTDGRVGENTMKAIQEWQIRVGMKPADGYPTEKVLNLLRQN